MEHRETALGARSEAHWEDWLAWAADRNLAVPDHPSFQAARRRVWEGSEFVALNGVRHPERFWHLIQTGLLERTLAPGELEAELRKQLDGCPDEETLKRRLRRFRQIQMIRIIWRDLSDAAPLDETLGDLSALAEACIRQSLTFLETELRGALGLPRDAEGRTQHLVVLAMGKLGARELNLSSDIDLIFAYPAAGSVDGPRPLANEQFFTRLARQLIQVLETPTADGFVFRVDTRLRPFGSCGPLVLHFDAMEAYYQSQAREWERYAMIKARVVAGPRDSAERLMALLRPFVYRRYLDFGAIDALRNLKGLITQELRRKGMGADIKLGPGGIREIEFIGQAFQLMRGGRDRDLQIRPIRRVLARLGEKGLLAGSVVRELDAAYVFLRRVENRLQAWRDEQTHRLPEEALGRLRLARTMGYEDWPAFQTALDGHRHRVQQHFDALFGEPQTRTEAQDSPLMAIWRGHLDEARASALLSEAGFQDPRAALQRLIAFRDGAQCRHLSPRGSERLERLMPLILGAATRVQGPDRALAGILEVLGSVARRTAYLAMLVEHPQILSQLAQLADRSPWISHQIAQHPLLLDELLDPRRLYAPLRRDSLQEELDALLAQVEPDDLEQQMERLRQFAQGNRLRVAAADLTGVIPLMVVSDYLTEIAEVSLQRVTELAYRSLREKHGDPQGGSPERSGFLVVGYGKLGGIELGYGSDLDLVFLQGREDPQAMTRGTRPISETQFYLRLGQRVIHMLTTRTPSGQLYEVDMRLRPDGNKGLLVRSLDAFARYQHRDAWTWEHQALVRARPVAGDAHLFDAFRQVRRAVLCQTRDPGTLMEAVRAMREKMRANLDRTGGGRFDLKQGPGGIVDIEFMVQYAVLRWAYRHPELTDWTDTIRILETLGRLSLFPEGTVAALTDAYKALRGAYHRSALQETPALVPETRLSAHRRRVQGCWQAVLREGCQDEHD